jgi:hypothetical protein
MMFHLAVVEIFKIVFGNVGDENPRLFFFANCKKSNLFFQNCERWPGDKI